MSRLPTVAIVGRPNTGKSTLFNRLVGHRKSIVSSVPGTTRDQVALRTRMNDMDCLLVDTGGIGGGSEDLDLEDDVAGQSRLALERADVILFTVNSKEELTAADFAGATLLRRHKRRHVPVIVVVTQCDSSLSPEEVLPRFYELGLGENIVPVSALHNIGMDELKHTIAGQLTKLHFAPKGTGEETGKEAARIAILGQPNVGKSSLINALMSEPERAHAAKLVSEIPGTTRDATDTVIRFEGVEYLFIDTAGLRRPARIEKETVEGYAALRSIQALEEADVALLLFDATVLPTRQDKRLASLILREGKGLIILVNKIDLLAAGEKKHAQSAIREIMSFCAFAPILPCSATTREGLLNVFPLIQRVHDNRHRRIATQELHTWFEDVVLHQPARPLTTVKHIVQTKDTPPTFALFLKDPASVKRSELKYLENRMRSVFDFDGTPIRWITKTA